MCVGGKRDKQRDRERKSVGGGGVRVSASKILYYTFIFNLLFPHISPTRRCCFVLLLALLSCPVLSFSFPSSPPPAWVRVCVCVCV